MVLLVLVTVLVVLAVLVVEQAVAAVRLEAVVLLLNLAHLDCLVLMDMATVVVLIPTKHVIQVLAVAVLLVLALQVEMVAKHLGVLVALVPSLVLL